MLKKYKIIEKTEQDKTVYNLYLRNKNYQWQIGTPIFFLINLILIFIPPIQHIRELISFLVTSLISSFMCCVLFLGENFYNHEKIFFSDEELHNYIAELKLLEKPIKKTYYLD